MAVPQIERLVAEKVEWQRQRREMETTIKVLTKALDDIGLVASAYNATAAAFDEINEIRYRAMRDTP